MSSSIKTGETLSIGSDESNSGAPFGPMSVAIVKLDEKNLKKIKKQKGYEDFREFMKKQNKKKIRYGKNKKI